MKNKLRNSLIPTLVIAGILGVTSCKKNYSPDTPFPPTYTASVFTGSNNKMVYSVDLQTGEIKWKVPVDAEVHATPTLLNNTVWVGTMSGHLYQLDRRTGSILQDKIFANSPIQATPLAYKGHLLVAAGNTLHCINVNTLADVWSYNAGSTIYATPTLHKIPGKDKATPAVFLATLSNKVVALDTTGAPIWQFAPSGGQAFYSSPCVVNDSFLYIGNDNGKVYAVNIQNGTQKWAFSTLGMVRSSPIQIGGNVLVGSNDRNLYSIDSATGLLRWKVAATDQIVSSPAIANQYVYFGSYDGFIYKVDIIDGHLVWKKPTFGLIKASPTIYRGSVIIGSFDKNLYNLDTADGAQIWVRDMQGQMEASAIIDTLGGAAVPSISGDYKY